MIFEHRGIFSMRWTSSSGKCIIYQSVAVLKNVMSSLKDSWILSCLWALCPDCKLTLPLIERLHSGLWPGLALLWITNPGTMARSCATRMVLRMEGFAAHGHLLSLCRAIPCVSATHFTEHSAAGWLFLQSETVTLLSCSSAQVLPGAKQPLALLPTALHSILASGTPSLIQSCMWQVFNISSRLVFP